MNPVLRKLAPDHDSCTECVADVTPVPDREMLAGELVALLLTVILPLADPLADGANVEVNVVVCPGARMIPLALLESKPAPATSTCEMVTLELPAFVSVTFCVPLLDTFTLPKFKALELELSNNVAVAVTVSEAALLVTVPALLLTVTENCEPLSVVVVAGVT